MEFPRFMASRISLVKSNQVILKLQSFHEEKIRAREKVNEFLSQYRPKYKPKSPPCLRPTLKKFNKVRCSHQCSEFSSYQPLRLEDLDHGNKSHPCSVSEKIEAHDMIQGFLKDETLEVGCKEIWVTEIGEEIYLFRSKPVTILEFDCYILDIKLGYHTSIHDKGGTKFLSSFESMDLLVSCKDSSFCVVIDRSTSYYYKGIRDKGGTISQRLFNWKSKNKDYVLGSDCSKVVKCEVSFDSSMIIDGEDAGYLGLHHLEACIDKNRKNGSKFTFSRFETSFCVVVHCDMCYCKGIRDKGGGSKFRKSADDEEKMVNLYFNRIGWPSSLPTNENESFVKNVLQKKKMAMDEFLMSEKLTLRPGVERFVDDAYKEGIHVVVLTTYSNSRDQIGRSIVETLGEERISKIKLVGDKEVDLSLYTQLVNDTRLSFSVDEQLAKEAIKAVSAEKQRVAEEVGSMLQLSVNINTSPPESLENIIATFRVGGEVAGLHVYDCVLISNTHFSCLNESGNSVDCSQDGMIVVVMLVAYTICIVVGGVFCSTYIELSRVGKMTFSIVSEGYMVHSFHMQKKLPFVDQILQVFQFQSLLQGSFYRGKPREEISSKTSKMQNPERTKNYLVCRYYQALNVEGTQLDECSVSVHTSFSCSMFLAEKSFGTTSTNHSGIASYHRCWEIARCTGYNLRQKNDQESVAATEALVNGKTTPNMMLHENYTMN